uniref:Uncharacterized protein n=1 Tax=Anopheles atroparvus TaxID=41427 RepID=A0A182IPF2_ANOAO
MTHATPMPPIRTTNTPPTFASPSSFAVELDLEVSSSLRVEHAADLRQLAVALDHVLDRGRLHQERVAAFAFDHALDALDVAGGEHGRPGRLHERPHALVGGEVRVLRNGKWGDNGRSAVLWRRWPRAVGALLTRKKAAVLPPRSAPYLIFVCLARSSADSIGESIRSTVRNAARLAV